MLGIAKPDFEDILLRFLSLPTAAHPHQLTLAEFCATRLRTVVQNLDFIATARTAKLTPKDAHPSKPEDENDAGIPRESHTDMRSEFIGGEGDDDQEYDEADVF